MPKKQNKPIKTCADCIHEFACRGWTNGRVISDISASKCLNYKTVQESGAYLCGVEEAKQPMTDAVQHPSHYTQGGIECIDAIRASMTVDGFCDYCKGNIIKYIWRWRSKGGVEDLRKASVYLDWLINAADKKEKK